MQVICDDEFYDNAVRLYFSSKCKTENISNEEGVSKTFGIQEKPSKTSTKNQREKKRTAKKQDSKDAKKREKYFTSLKSGSGSWADKFLNEKLEIAGENEELVLQTRIEIDDDKDRGF